jgi:hypothetical protein
LSENPQGRRNSWKNFDIDERIKLKCNIKVRCDGFIWFRKRSIVLCVNVMVKYRVP